LHLLSNVITDKEGDRYNSHVPFEKLNDACEFGLRKAQLGLRGFDFFFLFFAIRFYLLFIICTNNCAYMY